jgi:hypothetical protein
LFDAARPRRNGQQKARQELVVLRSRALSPVGPARRRDNAETAAPETEIFPLDPRTAFPGETAVIGKFRDAIGRRSITHLQARCNYEF